MRCTSARAKADETEDGVPIVSLELSERTPAYPNQLVAWIELPPYMARKVAQDLLEAAEAIEYQQQQKDAAE